MTGFIDNIRNYGSLPTTTIENLRWRYSDKRRLPDGPMTVQALRDFARANGLDLGHEREDNEDRERTIRHEAAHCAIAHCLGWRVKSVDINSGVTDIEMPDYATHNYSLTQRNTEYAAIAAAGAVFTNSPDWRDELAADRQAARSKGVDFEEAMEFAKRLAAEPYVKNLHGRLVAALTTTGKLEGADLWRVLEDE